MRGFNRHEDSPHTGMSVDLRTAQADFRAMQALGANFVRLCHYPHHPGELDLCDAMGLLVMCEIPVYWWTGLDEGEAEYAQKVTAAKRQLDTMIARDYNHPSIICWSVSNETREQCPGVVEGNDALIAHAKTLDSTRLVVHVADESVWTSATPHFPQDDIICVNGYPSWFKGMEAGNPHYDPAESTRFWQRHLARLHAAYPDKPIFVTEFGYPSLAGLFDGPLGEDTQARVLAAEFAGMAADYVCGTLVWCFADHLWPEKIGAIRHLTTSPFGVFSRARAPLRAAETVRRLFLRAEE
jgi:beta-glucuronidase